MQSIRESGPQILVSNIVQFGMFQCSDDHMAGHCEERVLGHTHSSLKDETMSKEKIMKNILHAFFCLSKHKTSGITQSGKSNHAISFVMF